MEQNFEIIRLSTWWISGHIDAISPDETLVTIWKYHDEESEDYSILLVEFPAGEIRAEIANDGFTKFNADGSLLVIGNFESPNQSVHLIETATGKIRAEIPGRGTPAFSNDGNSIIIFDQYKRVTRLAEATTGKVYAEIPGHNDIHFPHDLSPDFTLLAIHDRQAEKIRLIEVATGKIRAEISASGIASFSPDGKFFAVNDSKARIARLVDVQTGNILPNNEPFGFRFERSITPSEVSANKYLAKIVRFGEDVVVQEKAHKKLFHELAKINPLVAKAESYRSITPDGEIFLVEDEIGNKLHLVNLTTGEWFAKFDLFNPCWYALSDKFLIIERHRKSFYQLINARTGRILAMYHSLDGGAFETLGNGIFLLENGFSIDIYGTPEQKIEGMTPPRPQDGFATPKQEKVAIYESPITLVETWYSAYRDSILNVLGRYGEKWVYIAMFSSVDSTSFGWIRAELLEVIESWDESPELDPDDPMGSLKRASIKA